MRRGGVIRQRVVPLASVVITLERFDPFLRVIEREEPVNVQTLVMKAAVQRLDEGVIGQLSGSR